MLIKRFLILIPNRILIWKFRQKSKEKKKSETFNLRVFTRSLLPLANL